MLSTEEKEKVRPQYFKTIEKRLGWKIAYDDLPELDNPIYDVSIFVTKNEIDEKTGEKKTLYGFFQTTYNSNVSYEAFFKASRNPQEGGITLIMDLIDSQIYPYELDDVIAQLLHLGYHIQDVYKVDAKGKLNLNLTPDNIHDMIHQFCTQNSPLLDPASALKPKKMKKRTHRNFMNAAIYGPGKKPVPEEYLN